MYCHQCGKQIPDGSKFCRYCGAQQFAYDAAEPAPAQRAYDAPEPAPAQRNYDAPEPAPQAAEPAAAQPRERAFCGFLGALLGSLAGVAVLVVLAQLGYVSVFAGLVMAFCALMGYARFGKVLSGRGIVLSVLVIIVMVPVGLAVNAGVSTLRFIAPGWRPFLESFRNYFKGLFYAFTTFREQRAAYLTLIELGQQYAFAALGAIPLIIRAVRARAQVNRGGAGQARRSKKPWIVLLVVVLILLAVVIAGNLYYTQTQTRNSAPAAQSAADGEEAPASDAGDDFDHGMAQTYTPEYQAMLAGLPFHDCADIASEIRGKGDDWQVACFAQRDSDYTIICGDYGAVGGTVQAYIMTYYIDWTDVSEDERQTMLEPLQQARDTVKDTGFVDIAITGTSVTTDASTRDFLVVRFRCTDLDQPGAWLLLNKLGLSDAAEPPSLDEIKQEELAAGAVSAF